MNKGHYLPRYRALRATKIVLGPHASAFVLAVNQCMYSLMIFYFLCRKPNNFDLKCSTSQSCWYCQSRCDICMEPASFGYSVRRHDGTEFNFCSDTCHKFSSTPEEAPTTLAVSELCGSDTRTHKVAEEHAELLYIYLKGHFSSGQYGSVNITLCVGDGGEGFTADRVYAVYYCRTLLHQNLFEFFLDEQLQPAEPLPFADSDNAKYAITGLCSTGHVKDLIASSLKVKGYSDLSNLIATTKH